MKDLSNSTVTLAENSASLDTTARLALQIMFLAWRGLTQTAKATQNARNAQPVFTVQPERKQSSNQCLASRKNIAQQAALSESTARTERSTKRLDLKVISSADLAS